MGMRDALQEPDPVAIHVSSAANRQRFAETLAAALAERRYSNQRGNDSLLRLREGTVNPETASFTIRSYIIPGVRQGSGSMDKLVVGTFRDTATGSEFTGAVSAPLGKATVVMLACWAAFIALLFVSQAINTAGVLAAAAMLLVAGVVIFAPLAVLWPLIIRRNQRMEMKQAGSITRFLDAIAKEAASKPS